MIPFLSWLKPYRRNHTPLGNLTRKILKEKKICKVRNYNTIQYYLKSTRNFNENELQLFEKTYNKYQLEVLLV
jgi:hypothetical protein